MQLYRLCFFYFPNRLDGIDIKTKKRCIPPTFGFMKKHPLARPSKGAGPSNGSPKPTSTYTEKYLVKRDINEIPRIKGNTKIWKEF